MTELKDEDKLIQDILSAVDLVRVGWPNGASYVSPERFKKEIQEYDSWKKFLQVVNEYPKLKENLEYLQRGMEIIIQKHKEAEQENQKLKEIQDRLRRECDTTSNLNIECAPFLTRDEYVAILRVILGER